MIKFIINNAHILFLVIFTGVLLSYGIAVIDLQPLIVELSTPIKDAPFAWLIALVIFASLIR